MAKTSMIERQKKRVALVAKYAARRAALKAAAKDESLLARGALQGDAEAREAAAQLVGDAAAQPLRGDRAARAPTTASCACRASRSGISPRRARSRAWSSRAGKGRSRMSMNDPLGDMLTRIRNASMRGKSTVRTPASKIRKWVLDVLQAEGYIRGYEEVTDRRPPRARDLAQVLRRPAGDPRASPRLDPRPPRLLRRQGDPAGPPGPRRRHRLDAEGRHVRCTGPHRQRRRRGPLHRVLRRAGMSRIGKKPVDLPGGVTATVSGQTVEVKGPKGTRAFTATDDVTIAVEDGARHREAARHLEARAPAVGHVADPGGEPRHRRHRRASRRRWRSPASATAPRCRARC